MALTGGRKSMGLENVQSQEISGPPYLILGPLFDPGPGHILPPSPPPPPISWAWSRIIIKRFRPSLRLPMRMAWKQYKELYIYLRHLHQRHTLGAGEWLYYDTILHKSACSQSTSAIHGTVPHLNSCLIHTVV